MAIGIWTAAADPATELFSFGTLLKTFADKTREYKVDTGPHVKFTNMGCQPLFVVPDPVPTTDADALARGIPVGAEPESILALATGSYTLYSPYESLTVIASEGTLT